MAQNNPWNDLVDENDHVAFTYAAQMGDSFKGATAFIRPRDILYFRQYGDKGCKIVTMDPASRTARAHFVSEKPAQVLSQLGQDTSPTFKQAQEANRLPRERVSARHFICGTTSKHDDIRANTHVYFRMDAPRSMRTGRVSGTQTVIFFDKGNGKFEKFSLNETPAQLFALAGRPRPLTHAEKQAKNENERGSYRP